MGSDPTVRALSAYLYGLHGKTPPGAAPSPASATPTPGGVVSQIIGAKGLAPPATATVAPKGAGRSGKGAVPPAELGSL